VTQRVPALLRVAILQAIGVLSLAAAVPAQTNCRRDRDGAQQLQV